MMMETTTSVGLRRNRRKSRSMMAQMRCMGSASLHYKWTVGGRRRLQRVAQLMTGVMHEDVVEGRALDGKRGDRDVRFSRRVQQFNRRARAVVGGDAEDVVVAFHLGHFGQLLQNPGPMERGVCETD